MATYRRSSRCTTAPTPSFAAPCTTSRDKEDKVSTLRLKPCTDPAAPPTLPRVWGRRPAAIRFRDFPPPGAAAARRVHFAHSNQQNRPGTVSPGTPHAVFARPAAVLDTAAARPARNRRGPSRLDL
jgi:hypothetical protein